LENLHRPKRHNLYLSKLLKKSEKAKLARAIPAIVFNFGIAIFSRISNLPDIKKIRKNKVKVVKPPNKVGSNYYR
jgi:hypothetical protein